jgi:hypothetical protein
MIAINLVFACIGAVAFLLSRRFSITTRLLLAIGTYLLLSLPFNVYVALHAGDASPGSEEITKEELERATR